MCSCFCIVWLGFISPSKADANTETQSLEQNRFNNSWHFETSYTSEIWHLAKGGIAEDDIVYLDKFTVGAAYDIGSTGSLYIDGFYTNRQTFSEPVAGDFQIISNIDNSLVFRLNEAWFGHTFETINLSARFGIIDLNATFDVIETAELFINSSHGIGPEFSQSGENGPSIFPSTSTALQFMYQPGAPYDLRLGVFDAVPNDPDRQGKMDFSFGGGALFAGEGNFYGFDSLRVATGAWYYTADFEILGGGESQGGNWGAYAILETRYDSPLNGWVRIGAASNTAINPVSSYLGLGLVYNSATSEKSEQIGIALAKANPSSTLAGAYSETSIEVTYGRNLSEFVRVQPDIQYIINPGFSGTSSNILAVGFRAELLFSF